MYKERGDIMKLMEYVNNLLPILKVLLGLSFVFMILALATDGFRFKKSRR
jgi:hypothetical protein